MTAGDGYMLEAAGVVFDKIKTGNEHTKFKYTYTKGALMLSTCLVSLVTRQGPARANNPAGTKQTRPSLGKQPGKHQANKAQPGQTPSRQDPVGQTAGQIAG